jgi:multidrug transporter EmrE-like cation transporter
VSFRGLGLSFVVASVVFEACGQILFKQAAELNGDGMSPRALLRTVWRNQHIGAGIFCFIIETILWTLALSYLPVSIAFPAGSLCFVVVAVFSRIVFHEQVDFMRWIGITLILGGVTLVGLK